ncbi:MAG TPA: hypothetical protein VM450_19695 [Thermomicrobiales bacterium]|nr:hypothetical protein [Thermomicrobiales bacterium]
MRRTRALSLVVVLLLVSTIAVGAFPRLAVAQATPVGTPTGGVLTFDVQFRDTPIVADQAAGFQLGDRVILNDLLLQNGAEVGHNGGVCTIIDAAGGEMFCAVTWSLPDGTVSTQFLNTPPPEKTFAVVGGTGAYEGASGTGTLVEHGDETGTVTFNLGQ